MTSVFRLSAFAAIALVTSVAAQAEELNVYSARHYSGDDALYAAFTAATGITVNRIEDKEDPLLERIKSEGANSPADVFITVDAGRLWRAEEVLAPVDSETLNSRIPEHLRHPDGLWFGFSTRARVIVYNKETVDPASLDSYDDLADPAWKGKVCMRSGSNIYNLSLLASMIAHEGAEKAQAWAQGVKDNFAREPEGGDTDQIKGVAAGECAVTLSNQYYYVRLMKSDKPEDRAVAEKTGIIWPNQGTTGTHVNISGAGMVKTAPHPEAAVKFLEFLASDEAQHYFSSGNNEYPAVAAVTIDNPELVSLGTFTADTLNVSALGKNQAEAQAIYDRVGWK